MSITATYGSNSANTPVSIQQAQIHPVVFLHGILGSMVPQNNFLTSEGSMHIVLDPFLGSYWPMMDNLQKMGYEWGRTLFVVTYDWRQSNNISANHLAAELTSGVKPLANQVSYVDHTGVDANQADLIVHSMGGLVTRAYLEGFAGAYNDDVRKVIFIASPHKGFPFDYQTWEGMTWSTYLKDAPFTAGSSLLALFMNANLWPMLVAKRFQPQNDDLAVCSFWNQHTDWAIGLHPWEVAVAGNYAGAPGTYVCSQDIVAAWAHGLNPAQPAATADINRASW
jgi:pimeloyl-ACP methyl ester carboxylesterase